MQMSGLPEKNCGGADCEVNQTVIYIKKKKPPSKTIREVSRIKSNPDWKKIQSGNTKAIRNKFDELSKEPIRQSLLEEQSGLCAYCMRRIENNGRTTRIEHWYPLSKDKDQALDYRNMLAVCDGGANYQGNEKKILCCDAFKGDDEELMISPLNVQHMQKITYDKKGYIKTKPFDAALEKDINERLRLNGLWKDKKFIADTSTGLVKGRKDTYQLYERFIKKLDRNGRCGSAQVKKKIDEIQTAEQKPEFAGVWLYFLNKKYISLLKRGL